MREARAATENHCTATEGGRTTDGDNATTEDHRTTRVQPQAPETTSQQVDNKTIDTPDTSVTSAEPVVPADRSCNRVETEGRVGENGETLHGRVDEAAAARGPGTATTADTTDGTSLITPASGLQDRMVQLVKPPPSPPVESTTAPPKRTPPRANESHAMGQAVAGRDNDDKDRRAHKRIDDPADRADTSTDETAATATASASMDAAAPRNNQAKATRDQGQLTKTSASAQSASRDHPDTETTDLTRPSRDPEDATGDDERCQDAPTEPPDMPEGTRGQGSRKGVEADVSRRSRGQADVEGAKVGAVETSVLQTSRSVQEGPGDGDDEERWPGVLDEPSDEPSVECQDPAGMQVDPGGETKPERNESAALESADTEANGRVAGACRDAQVMGESAGTRRGASIEAEEWSASTHARSTTRAEENGQRTSTGVDDAPRAPPEPPQPPEPPDEAANRQNEPPSVELEGERIPNPSCDVGRISAEANASGPSEDDEDARDRLKKLVNMSDHISEGSKRRGREDSPKGAQDERDDPGDNADASTASWSVEDVGKRSKKLREALKRIRKRSERRSRTNSPGRPEEEPVEPSGGTAVPDGIHDVQERPRKVRNERVDETDAPRRDWPPGGHLGHREESEDVEGDRERRKVVEGGGHDGIRPKTDRNACGVDTNPQRRDRGPGGQFGERDGSGDVERNLERQSDGNGDERSGERGGKDGATSGAHGDSKRVDTSSLAEDETDQHGQRKRTTTDAPEPYKPLSIDHRPPADHPNPPRRRGRLKMRPREVSRTRANKYVHLVERSRRNHIGRPRCDEYTP